MFIRFFQDLRRAGVPVTLKEYLTLLEAMEKGIAGYDIEHFYFLARACLVKDERHIDRFDIVFKHAFEGAQALEIEIEDLPEEWLRQIARRFFSEEEMKAAQARGGWEELLEELRERLREQKERHQGGGKWIGTLGTSPFGAYGFNPMGIRIGQHESRNRSAVKVWDKREFANFDDSVELGTRNLKIALRRLRKFVREGAAEELDLPGTIHATANNAGHLDLKMVPTRENQVKVLLFLDAGGSMDDHVRLVEELFSAARSEIKHLEHFYFHNCVYEQVWKDNRRRGAETLSVFDVLHKYGSDYKVIFVGDASMSPYEISLPGGSIEHWNEESGATWMRRILDTWKHAIWLNPVPEGWWQYTHSIGMVHGLMEKRMFPLTLEGLEAGMRELSS